MRKAAAATAPPATEVVRKFLREVMQPLVIISFPLSNHHSKPLDGILQIIRSLFFGSATV
jgi:hypothetical protein